MDFLNTALDTASQIVGRLTKLDPANLVWILAIVFGYVLKWVAVFPNRFIPLASCLATISSYCAMVFQAGQPPKKYVADIVLGILFWGFAWGLHAAILKRWIDEKLFQGATGNTAFLDKDKTP